MNVFMYTLSTCPWCKKTKQWFKDHSVPFEYIDYDLASKDEQKQIQEKVKGSNLSLSFPIVYIGSEVFQGHNPDKYQAALEKQK